MNETIETNTHSLLTEAQLEIAARKYCELAGLNPDEQVGHGAEPDESGVVLDVMLYSPRWKRVAIKIAQYDIVRVCIAFAQRGVPTICEETRQ
jgi:hypothetical protein